MLEYYEICVGLFHGFDYSKFKTGKARERLAVIPPAIEHVLKQDKDKGKNVFSKPSRNCREPSPYPFPTIEPSPSAMMSASSRPCAQP